MGAPIVTMPERVDRSRGERSCSSASIASVVGAPMRKVSSYFATQSSTVAASKFRSGTTAPPT